MRLLGRSVGAPLPQNNMRARGGPPIHLGSRIEPLMFGNFHIIRLDFKGIWYTKSCRIYTTKASFCSHYHRMVLLHIVHSSKKTYLHSLDTSTNQGFPWPCVPKWAPYLGAPDIGAGHSRGSHAHIPVLDLGSLLKKLLPIQDLS